jgi:hypothetical protein
VLDLELRNFDALVRLRMRTQGEHMAVGNRLHALDVRDQPVVIDEHLGRFELIDRCAHGLTAVSSRVARASSETPDAATRDPQRVRAMFSRIAPRYDLANHLLSGGADFIWRRRAARIVSAWSPARILDLATGTGDLALVLQRRLPNVIHHRGRFF